MTPPFKSEYSEHDAFYARGNLLRPQFGNWDCVDPVAHAILDVVEAQSEISDLHADDATYGIGTREAAFTTAVEKRHAAIKRLLRVAEDCESWPDPEMGLRS
jgi:hypothetical protein